MRILLFGFLFVSLAVLFTPLHAAEHIQSLEQYYAVVEVDVTENKSTSTFYVIAGKDENRETAEAIAEDYREIAIQLAKDRVSRVNGSNAGVVTTRSFAVKKDDQEEGKKYVGGFSVFIDVARGSIGAPIRMLVHHKVGLYDSFDEAANTVDELFNINPSTGSAPCEEIFEKYRKKVMEGLKLTEDEIVSWGRKFDPDTHVFKEGESTLYTLFN